MMLSWWVLAVVMAAFMAFYFLKSKTPPKPAIRFTRNKPTRITTSKTGKRYLVTGGHGFLGSNIVEALLARGETDVRILDMVPSHLFEEEQKESPPRVTFFKGSILDSKFLEEALEGVDTVFHTAALVNFWERLPHQYDKIYSINVTGTEKLLDAARKCHVKQFIHMSSASIFITPDIIKHPLRGVDESTPPPPPEKTVCHYTSTKSLAEKIVLECNGKDGLLTAATRIAGLFGPRDAFVSAQFLRKETLIGMEYKQDFVYVENVAHAMLCVEKHLKPSSDVGGQAYFITNGEPVSSQDFKERMAKFFNNEPVKPFSFLLLKVLAYSSEFITRISRGKITLPGDLAIVTVPVVYLSCEYFFSDAKAKKELGYSPVYSLDEGIELSSKYIHNLLKTQEKDKNK